jgi:TolB-like protein/Flp pilus assembly protein TadD
MIRIGVNLGDVIIEDDDIHGDGINVAARLEGLAEPGGILVSGTVHEHVRGKLDFSFDDLGLQEVKNIAEPVRAFRLAQDEKISSAEPVSMRTDRPVVAILPFDNMSGDTEQEYFSDGIAEDLITALSRVRQIRVVARNSTFSYKGKSPNIRQVSEELGARYVVEGSVRKAGNRIRVTAQLIDGETGNHIWAERYDREITDIFDVQDELTETLVGAIAPGIGGAERQRAKQKPPESLDTWDLYQRGMWHLHRRSLGRMDEELLEARAQFEKAIELDPEFAPAYAAYAETIYFNSLFGFRDEDLETALKAARKAVELDSDDANAHVALGRIYRLSRNQDAAEAENKIALELNPSLAEAHHGLGSALVHAGKAQEAIPYIETAIRLSPHDDLIGPFHVRLAEAHLFLGNHEEAAEWAQKAVRLRGTQWPGYACLASALGHLGRIDDAKKAIIDLKDVQPRATISFARERLPWTDTDCMDHMLDGLRKAGLPE